LFALIARGDDDHDAVQPRLLGRVGEGVERVRLVGSVPYERLMTRMFMPLSFWCCTTQLMAAKQPRDVVWPNRVGDLDADDLRVRRMPRKSLLSSS